jgi:LTXXQ motif family protein
LHRSKWQERRSLHANAKNIPPETWNRVAPWALTLACHSECLIMRKIGAYAAIGVLAAVIFSPSPIAAFGLRVGPFSLGLPVSFGHRHRIDRHPDVRPSAILYNSAEPGTASARDPTSALLYPELALPTIFDHIFSPTPSLSWSFGYYSIFRAAFAKAPADQDQYPCRQVVRGTAIVERIGREIRPTAAQRPLLQKLGGALGMASGFLAKLCPKEIPSQPVARLQLMETQIEELIMALDIIGQPLREFEQSLSRSQKTRFAAAVSTRTDAARSNGSENIAPACGATQTVADWSIEQIDQSVQPSDVQRDALVNLKQAFGRAASDLDAHCPISLPRTALARLELIQARLDAAWQAMLSIDAALANFETRLSHEQRGRLDAMIFAAAR